MFLCAPIVIISIIVAGTVSSHKYLQLKCFVVFRFLVDQMGGLVSSLQNVTNMDQLMTSGSMNFPNCTFRTGWKNLGIRSVKEHWGRILLITGQMGTMSKCIYIESRDWRDCHFVLYSLQRFNCFEVVDFKFWGHMKQTWAVVFCR